MIVIRFEIEGLSRVNLIIISIKMCNTNCIGQEAKKQGEDKEKRDDVGSHE